MFRKHKSAQEVEEARGERAEALVPELLDGVTQMLDAKFAGHRREDVVRAWATCRRRLFRFARGHDSELAKCVNEIRGAIDSRDEFDAWWRPDEFAAVECELESDLRMGRMYQRGVDKCGRPLVLQRTRVSDLTIDHNIRVRSLFMTCDRLEARMDAGELADQWTVVFDQRGGPLKGRPTARQGLKFCNNLTKCYPERLYKCYMVDCPFALNLVVRMILPFLEERTRNKLKLATRQDEGDRCEELLADFDEVEVASEYGGRDSFSFHADSHWPYVVRGGLDDNIISDGANPAVAPRYTCNGLKQDLGGVTGAATPAQ